MSTSQNTINSLNSREHQIELIQDTVINEVKTDKNGLFKIRLSDSDSIKIIVNKEANLLKGVFRFKTADLADSLKLRISDKKIAIYHDSISAPKFYKKYNEKMAIKDFNNGNAKILGSGDWLTDEIVKKRKKLSEKYNFKYEYIFGCLNSMAEKRIAYRYNEKMKKLIGIKNVW